jgi:uncharacterized protein
MHRVLTAVALILAAPSPAPATDLTFFTIGAGTIGGGYYAAARAICEEVHAAYPGVMRCSTDPTPGSVYNVVALAEGQLDFALVQSDAHHYAVTGTGPFAAAGPNPDLRSVLALYPEPLTLVARRDAGVGSIADLPGKRVNLGPRNSGSRATASRLLDVLGIAEEDLAEARALPMSAAVDQLCAGDLDAMLAVVGHPNAAIARALAECDTVLVPIAGPAIDAHVAENADYTLTTIPRGTYDEQPRAVRSFSVTATLMTRAEVPPEVVSAVARIIVDTLPDLNRRAPVIPATRLPGIASDGLTAPLHEGAASVLEP